LLGPGPRKGQLTEAALDESMRQPRRVGRFELPIMELDNASRGAVLDLEK
jgi:hypothetical protein